MRYRQLPNLRNLWYLFVVLYVSKDWIYICLQLIMLSLSFAVSDAVYLRMQIIYAINQ